MPTKYKFSKEQIDKLGNTIRFFTKTKSLSKTKLLKLIYLLEELSIKKSGIPFFNFGFYVWKFGPVVPVIYVELSTEPTLLKNYFDRNYTENHSTITCKGNFCYDEFSENDIDLLNYVDNHFGNMSTPELIKLTHRENSPWYIAAQNNNILDQLENGEINMTEIPLDIFTLIKHDVIKAHVYNNYIECFGNPLNSDQCLNLAH